jgi:hypothetical protein
MKQNSIVLFFLTAIMITTATVSFKNADTPKRITRQVYADSAQFIPNISGGWSTYLAYINRSSPDSIEFELLLKHDNNINWRSKQQIGSIVDPIFFPKKEQKIIYDLLYGNTWKLEIKTNGECYFNQISGPDPSGNPIIMPVKVNYKNN